MSTRVDPQMLFEIKEFGAANVEKCFNCGNCTAVCSMTSDADQFPRKIIRMAQLGLRDELLGSKELWLCYNCGQCSETCPQQADPGEYMASARRYAIASYDPTGLAKMLYTSPILSVIFLVILAAAIGLFFFQASAPMNMQTLRLFEFVPSEFLHNAGIIAGLLIVLAALAGMINMTSRTFKAFGYPKGTRFDWLGAARKAFGQEALGQSRYRKDCESSAVNKPWYVQKWFIHASVLWGFLGLFVVTALNYLLELLGVKSTGTWVPLWYPIRLLGTISGLFLLYGTSLSLLRRFRKDDTSYEKSTLSDWAFLTLMWLAGVTGFLLEVAVYLPPFAWSYWMLLAHLIVVGELLLLAPFTKFAHAIYRSIALYLWALEPLPEKEGVKSVSAAD